MLRSFRTNIALLAALVSTAGAQAAPLTLERVLELAQERNERARIAEANQDAANGRLAQARAFFFPSLTLNGNYTRRAFETVRDVGGTQVTVSALNALSATAQVRWTVFDARGIPLYRSASALFRASTHELDQAKRLLAFEAADAFLQTLTADALLQAAERRTAVAQQALTEAKARLAAGLVGNNDVTQAQLAASDAEVARTDAAATATAARINMAYLLSVPTTEVAQLVVPEALLETANAQPFELEVPSVTQAQQRRPDVQTLKEQATAAGHAADEPLMRLVPSVSVTGQARATNETGLSGRPVDGFVGVDLTWVLFDGGDRYGAHRALLAQERAAQLRARLGERQVAADLEKAMLSLRTSRVGLEQARLSETIATQNTTETGLLYKQGLTTAFQLADASTRQFEASAAWARKRYAVVVSLLDVRAALGLDPLGREVKP